MKKAILSVGIFLIGISTQANVTTESKVYNPWGNYAGYLSSQSVTFYEDGILFEVFLDGSFTYRMPGGHYYNRRGRANNRSRARGNARVNYNRGRYGNYPALQFDRFGVLYGIGFTNITYKPNGKVRRIGSVRMRYTQGRLISVGGMEVFYGRRGQVAHTFGNINPFNTIYGPCGIAPSNYFGQRYFGIDTRNRNSQRVVRNSGRRSQADVWNDDWDDDDDDRRGRRSRD